MFGNLGQPGLVQHRLKPDNGTSEGTAPSDHLGEAVARVCGHASVLRISLKSPATSR
jgi:hypothetical protein